MSCPPFYKQGILANGKQGCVPAWDEGQGTKGIITLPPNETAEIDASLANVLRIKDEIQKEKEHYNSLLKQQAENLQYVSRNPHIPQVILLGTALVLIVFSLVAINRG